MSVSVDVKNSADHVECVAPNNQSSQTRQDLLNNEREVADRPAFPEKSKPGSFDDAALSETIRLAQLGDPSAFEIIYQKYASRVYALCLRMLRDSVDAEDLTQEAFLQLFRKLNTFRGESAFSTWLHRLTVNLVLMRLRKKSPPTVSIDAAADPENELDPPTIDVGAHDLLLEGSLDRLRLERCIAQLPAGYRAVFVLISKGTDTTR